MSYTETHEAHETRELHREIGQLTEERDAALADLAQVKRDIGWTMEKLKIKDLICNSDAVPAAQDGWLPLWQPAHEDSDRLAWINQHGRTSLGSGVFVIALPHGGMSEDATLPEPYNIRHIIDLCRKNS